MLSLSQTLFIIGDTMKYYLTINLPPNFDRQDADNIKADLISYMNSKNQYGALYGPKSDKKGITVGVVSYTVSSDENQSTGH